MQERAGRAARIERVVAGVIKQAFVDAGAKRVLVLDDDSPEARLSVAWCRAAVGTANVVTLPYRDAANHDANVLVAYPANKTALLLGGAVPFAHVLPIGDLYASRVAELTGEWSGPPTVVALAQEMSGIARLDAALTALLEERRPAAEALQEVPAEPAQRLLALLEAGRFGRLRAGLVPKLGARTIGIDLFC